MHLILKHLTQDILKHKGLWDLFPLTHMTYCNKIWFSKITEYRPRWCNAIVTMDTFPMIFCISERGLDPSLHNQPPLPHPCKNRTWNVTDVGASPSTFTLSAILYICKERCYGWNTEKYHGRNLFLSCISCEWRSESSNNPNNQHSSIQNTRH